MKLKLLSVFFIGLVVSQIGFCETTESVTEIVETTAQHSEIVSALIKFAIVMLAVMLSSVVIFLGLSVWNAILNRSRSKVIDYEASLRTPRSVDEAVLLFIQKNRLK